MSDSLFCFNFRLTPWEGCLNLSFDKEELAPGFGTVCTRDHLAILWVGDPQRNEEARATAYTLARRLVHADAYESFPTGIVLNVEPVTWLEVREHVLKNVVSGYMHQTLATSPLDSEHPDKARLKRATALVRQLHDHSALQLALADFYTARSEIGPYLAFYAFRVLEDVGFHFGTNRKGGPDWDAMNESLGTTKEKWKVLIDAGKKARHLSTKGLVTLETEDPLSLITCAREALEGALRAL